MSGVTRLQWAATFLSRCGFPQTPTNLIGMLAWIRSEWAGSTPIPAKWNPLSTVQTEPGSTEFNSVGVQNFRTYEDGLAANSKVLLTGDYPGIRLQLSNADDDNALVIAIAASHWGSKPNANILQYVSDHFNSDADLVIGTPNPAVPPESDMILCPNKPPINGRQPFAVLDVPNRQVLLFNGASLSAGTFVDKPVSNYRVWPVPTSATLLGMDATRDPSTHVYDNRGVVVSANDGSTFEAHWR